MGEGESFSIYSFSSPPTKSVDDDDDLMKSPEKALKLYEAQQSRGWSGVAMVLANLLRS